MEERVKGAGAMPNVTTPFDNTFTTRFLSFVSWKSKNNRTFQARNNSLAATRSPELGSDMAEPFHSFKAAPPPPRGRAV